MVFPILGGNSVTAGYSIDNSLRFNDNDSPYLSRSISSTGSQTTASFSCWLKRGNLGINGTFFSNKTSASGINSLNYRFNTSDQLVFSSGTTGDANYNVTPTQVLRDVSAWYHILAVTDTTESAEGDRFRVWINGVEVDNFSSFSMPAQNTNMRLSNSSYPHTIGEDPRDNAHFDGYLADVYFIDGTAKSPTDFGEFDEDSGIWKPIEYTGSYGTNGFYLDFENSGSLGADQSGNGNNFTPTNLASTDQTTDTPTNNFCTLNSLANGMGATLSEGNLKATGVANDKYVYSTFGLTSGKWYFENKVITQSTRNIVGFGDGDHNDSTASSNYSNVATWNGSVGGSGTVNSSLSAFSSGDILCVAMDLDNGQVWFSKNANIDTSTTANMTGLATSGLDRDYRIYYRETSTPSTNGFNFGNPFYSISSGNSDDNGYGNFEYAPPSGYLALCTQNLATELSPTIDDGSEYFNTVLYTGNGGTQSITGVNFQPDWVWLKQRANDVSNRNHMLFDSNRGTLKALSSNITDTEDTSSAYLTSYDSDGFTLGSSSVLNRNTTTYASWNWLANGGTTSSNTDGSITSTVQANTTAGFSIVTYTGNATAGATIGHGLGVTPSMFIIKGRSLNGSWVTFHKDLGATKALSLQGTNAPVTSSAYFNNTAPTSSLITLGYDGAGNEVNNGSDTFVAYCFAEIEGYSKFGSYTGNGGGASGIDGTFVFTSFRPAFVMIKRTDSATNWRIYDSKRDTYNVMTADLRPNLSNAEGGQDFIDFLSNGFKLKTNGGDGNASGGTYIYMAFAENPFVSSTGIPVTAR